MANGGRFVWYELATTDTEVAKAFYSTVVGWGTGQAPMPGSVYTLFTAQGVPVAGLTKVPPAAIRAGATPRWTGYVAVDDVDLVASRVEPLGGILHIPPTDVPNVSRFSVIGDPEGAMLALIRGQKTQELSARPFAPGHVSWHELLVSDLDRAFAFYSGLLNWQKTEVQAGSSGLYQQLFAGTEVIGGMFPKLESWPRSIWLYYFTVPDVEAAAKRTVAAGGDVVHGPFEVPGGAIVVLCTDPQGALFALIDRRVYVSVGCYASSAKKP